MSKRNKHGWNNTTTGGISYRYMHDVLGPWEYCPKPSCKGCLHKVRVRYFDHGPIHHEKVCVECEKVIRDPKHKDLMEQGRIQDAKRGGSRNDFYQQRRDEASENNNRQSRRRKNSRFPKQQASNSLSQRGRWRERMD